MKTPARMPAAILGAASAHTSAVRGDSETESGSTSPKTRISRAALACEEVGDSARMKYAVLSMTHWSCGATAMRCASALLPEKSGVPGCDGSEKDSERPSRPSPGTGVMPMPALL